jgi:hypothetical protein
MIAPGDNLEFLASLHFRGRVRAAPEVKEAVKQVLRRDPRAGVSVCGNIKELAFVEESRLYVVLFGRRNNNIFFMYLFDGDQKAELEATKEDIQERYRRGELK